MADNEDVFENLILTIEPQLGPKGAASLRKMRQELKLTQDEANQVAVALGNGIVQALDNVDKSTQKATPGVTKIRNAFAQLALQATGMQGPLGGVASSLLMFSAGSATVIAIAAGLAIIGKAYADLKKPIEEAEKAADSAQDTLLKTLRSKDQESNPVRFAREQLDGAKEQLRLLQQAQTRLESFAPNVTNTRDRAANETNQQAVKANIAELTVKLDEAEAAAAKVAEGINQTFNEQQAAKIKATAAAAESFRKQLEDMGNAATASLLDDTATAMARLLEQATRLGVEGPELGKAIDALNQKLQQAQTLNLIGDPEDIRTIEEAETVLSNLRDLREKGVATSEAEEAIQKRILVLLQKQAAAVGEHANGAELVVKDAGEFEESVQKTKKNLEEQLELATEIARGVIGITQAFGLADAKAAALLQNVVGIASSLPGALSGNAGSIFSLAGSVIGAISSLFGESPEEKQAKETLQKNTEALDRVRSGLEQFGNTLPGNTLQKARTASLGAISEANRRGLEGFLPKDAAALAGISLRELMDVAQEFGVTLDGSRQSWVALNNAIADNDLRGFTKTFEGLSQALSLRADLFDLTDQQRLTELASAAAGASPNTLGGLKGLDLTTAVGRAAAEKLLQDVLGKEIAGQIGSKDLGDLSRDQFNDLLRELEGLIDSVDASGRVGGTTEQFGISQTITSAEASQITALMYTANVYHQRVADNTDILVSLVEQAVARRFGEALVPVPVQARMLGDSAAERALALGNNRIS